MIGCQWRPQTRGVVIRPATLPHPSVARLAVDHFFKGICHDSNSRMRGRVPVHEVAEPVGGGRKLSAELW